jgi:hypothetical protein
MGRSFHVNELRIVLAQPTTGNVMDKNTHLFKSSMLISFFVIIFSHSFNVQYTKSYLHKLVFFSKLFVALCLQHTKMKRYVKKIRPANHYFCKPFPQNCHNINNTGTFRCAKFFTVIYAVVLQFGIIVQVQFMHSPIQTRCNLTYEGLLRLT